jgi:cellulose synthase/poly-beta-1,6-N-acetylglucosamine synthase-like glycosyltransferase
VFSPLQKWRLMCGVSACGEIAAYKGPMWRYLLNPLVAAQNFEYKMRYGPVCAFREES